MVPVASDPVVIVGGGFGGLYTALALAHQRRHAPILLVEPREHFLFLPLLYELLSHELRRWEIAPRYDTLLAGRGIAWLQDRVTRIDAAKHQIHSAGGRTLSYGQAVIASGSTTQTFGIPGAVEHCLGFRSLADVERLQSLIADLRQQHRPLQRLAVVGAGASGVELACKLADELQGAALVELIEQGPELLPQARAFNREQAALALQRRDVRVRTNTAVTTVGSDHLLLGPQTERLPVQGVIWTAGIRCQPPALTTAAAAPASDHRGRLRCSTDLQVAGAEDVFAIGDVAWVDDSDGLPLPSNAQVAFQQAECLADNLWRARRGEPLKSFVYKDLGEMMSLGRQDASVTAGGVTLAGRAAFELRRLAYLTRLPGRSHQARVAAGWLSDW
ncbi:MAG: NAD(P)/FAD-dependent oxidoreductase [Cyanobacteria bacterium K_DeepCast_35m_m2_023]|nr:NAD(P)/FAD-dependent oxidoreductase [Cyanobacteria bacterium K_DeepCast_35m_m2_023]